MSADVCRVTGKRRMTRRQALTRLTDVPLEGLPAADDDRAESALLGELRDLASRIDPPPVWGKADPC